jgi:hypothetical protein
MPKQLRPRVGDTVILFGECAVKIRAATRYTVDISPGTIKPIPVRMLACAPKPTLGYLMSEL